MCDFDGERASVWHVTPRRARKRTVCDLCGLPIVVGSSYDRIGACSDGSWHTYTVHRECHSLQKMIAFDVCKQESYLIGGGIRENVREHMTDEAHGRDVLAMWRDILRARRAEGTWPVARGMDAR